MIEKLVRRQFSNYLEKNNLLPDLQFEFRQQHSTELATALFNDCVKRTVVDEGKLTRAIFIDLSKAFDRLSHTKVLIKLQ